VSSFGQYYRIPGNMEIVRETIHIYNLHISSSSVQNRAVQVIKKVLRRRQIYIDIAEKTANAVPSV
jgi:hypothetical protein